MIHGIGTDMVTIGRIQNALDKHGGRFTARILCPMEAAELAAMAATQPAARFVAKRFAVKEAFSKAFGSGIGAAVGWHDVAVSHDAKGKPLLAFSEAMRVRLAEQNIAATHVSIADEAEQVIAFVILEKK